ncbi:MAG: CDP-diacylglycerol--glycerol-3-phosphate 3-phosphatidyltransferase [Firmicutes bacterium]|nr:CDP-diacylglycerol--glycerol-3-phosphate 3-phosphatidyltransferase [Bacillota bacterium]
MNLPTKLTFLRILLIPVFVALFFIPFTWGRFAALGVFALAAFTDFLDGYLARKNNQVTTLGKFLDPIADKMLVACALIAVAVETDFPSWIYSMSTFFQILIAVFTMIILCRELMVSCFRIVASGKGLVLAADKLGKVKTVFQMAALLFLIPCVSISEMELKFRWLLSSNFHGYIANNFYAIGIALLFVATILTIISGANYIIKNKGVFKENGKSAKCECAECGSGDETKP